MPVQTIALDAVDIQEELARRGYGFHGNRNVAIHLTRKMTGERFRITGQPKVQLLTPITFQHYQTITHKSATVAEACDQIEAISTGRQLGPNFGGGGGGMSPDVVEKVIESRMENMVARATAPMAERMADQQAKLDDQTVTIESLQARLAEYEGEDDQPAPRASKKKAKKKAAKGKRRDVVAEAIAQIDDNEDFDADGLTEYQRKANANADEPRLSKDQQAMLGQVQMERPD